MAGKCATEGCLKEAHPHCRHCARCVRSGLGTHELPPESLIKSTKREESFSMVPGAKLQPSLESAFLGTSVSGRSTTATLPTVDKNKTPIESGSEKMPTELKSRTETVGASYQPLTEKPPIAAALKTEEKTQTALQSSADGTRLEEKSISQKSMPDVIDANRPGSLTAPLLSCEEEKLASLSLVDDVTQRLHLQMQRLTVSHTDVTTCKDPLGASHSERQRVGLALKTASEIGKMIRLKIDAVRVFRDLE